LEDYLSKCDEDGTDPMIDPTNLPVEPPNALKRKKTKSKETSSSKQGQSSGSSSEKQAKSKSTVKRKRMTVINLEESSAEEKANSSAT
jgi:hypothetical protein